MFIQRNAVARLSAAFVLIGFGLQCSGAFAAQASDFNNDTFDDLAIGVPAEDVGVKVDAGAVHILYGAVTGIVNTGDQVWTLDKPGMPVTAEGGEGFGTALASGDFDNDGFIDLAIGVPFRNTTAKADSGAVVIMYGTAGGLTTTDSQLFSQDTGVMEGVTAKNDHFGAALAVGDFNNDGFDDLAIGVPREKVSLIGKAGAVAVIFGSAAGLTDVGNQLWNQDSVGISDSVESGDMFGLALASGDFDDDTYDDLAIGVPLEDIGPSPDAGAVHVIYGSMTGLDSAGSQVWWQGNGSILDLPEPVDLFGSSLATGYFNGDAAADLAIGAPGEAIGTKIAAGALSVIYGSVGVGLASAGNQFLHQDASGIADTAEQADAFGASLAAGDYSIDGYDDIVVGVPNETVSIAGCGAVHVIYGSVTGFNGTGDKLWQQVNLSIDTAMVGDAFGAAVGSGDFDNDSAIDLVVGAPFKDVSGKINAGAAYVVYGVGGSGLVAAGAQKWSQNSSGIGDSCEASDALGAAVGP